MGNYAPVRFTHEGTTSSKRHMQEQILEMRNAGMTFENISKALGVTQRYVWKLHEEALNAIITPGVELMRKQEGERLDAMLVPLMAKILSAKKKAERGDLTYETPVAEIDRALAISTRRSRIFGLDVPLKIAGAPIGGPLELQNLNLTAMSTEELGKFRELLAKAMPSPEDEGDDLE